MYQELISFLNIQKKKLTKEEADKFLKLLSQACGVEKEYKLLECEMKIGENKFSNEDIDVQKKELVSTAINNILKCEDEKKEEDEMDDHIFIDESQGDIFTKPRKLKRVVKKVTVEQTNKIIEFPKDICRQAPNSREIKQNWDGTDRTMKEEYKFDEEQCLTFNFDANNISQENEDGLNNGFCFEVGELEEVHLDGPSYTFNEED